MILPERGPHRKSKEFLQAIEPLALVDEGVWR